MKLVDKILFYFEKFKFTDNKLTLVRITFLRTTFNRPEQKKLTKLSTTTWDLFHFIVEFHLKCSIFKYICSRILYKKSKQILVTSSSCVFHDNLFIPKYYSSIVSDESLNKNTFQTLLNKLFSWDRKDNGKIIKVYTANKIIKFKQQKYTKICSSRQQPNCWPWTGLIVFNSNGINKITKTADLTMEK